MTNNDKDSQVSKTIYFPFSAGFTLCLILTMTVNIKFRSVSHRNLHKYLGNKKTVMNERTFNVVSTLHIYIPESIK